MKKTLIFLLALTIAMSSSVAVFAYEPVSAFWPVNTKYAAAKDSNDFPNMIKYGIESMKYIENDLDDPTALEWYESRAEFVAYAYERLGEYDKSAEYCKIALPLAAKRNMIDSVKVLSAKINHFPTTLDLYQLTDETQSYYGAVNEHEKGVYYGLTSDSHTNMDNPSGMLLYVEYGDYFSEGWMNKVLTEANEKGIAVEIALNVPQEGYNFRQNIINRLDYAEYLSDFLAKYQHIKFFIRFGAEVDIWSTPVDPADFKEAFRKIADMFHYKMPYAAMVFSPNMVPPWNVDVNDYYPGDEYVDWIGVSLYMNKYFRGIKITDPNDKEARDNEAVFGANDYANPVVCLKHIVDLYGHKKPIMISESGASHYIRPHNENATNWAINRLKQIYSYVPMVYPQVKLIMHFDKVMPNEFNDYSLSENSKLTGIYKELVSAPNFIQDANLYDVKAYKKAESGIVVTGNQPVIYSYASVFDRDEYRVNYYVDDKYAGCANYYDNYMYAEIPHKAVLDLSSVDMGKHTLKVVVEDSNKVYLEKFYPLDIRPTVRVNGHELSFDVPPEVINNRTMVPMRAIFERLGAVVNWNSSTQTVYAYRGNTNLSLTIGENYITANGRKIELDVPAILKDGRTLVPLRAVSECLNCVVDWNETEKCAYIKG